MFSILRDPTGQLTLADITANEREDRFKASRERCPSFGFTSDTFWIRFVVRSESSKPRQLMAELENARFDLLEWHVFSGEQEVYSEKTGNLSPYSPVSLRMPMPALAFDLLPGEEVTIYLRAETETSVFFPLTVHSVTAYTDNVIRRASWKFAHMGLCTALILISGFLGLVLRMRLFGFHAGIVASYLAHSWIYNGCYVWLQWPLAEYMTRQGVLVIGGLGLLFLLAYVREFFGAELRKTSPHLFIKAAMWGMAGCLVLIAVLPYWVGVHILNFTWIAANGIGAGTSIWQYAVRKRIYWRFNMLAWAISGVLVALVLLELAGVIPVIVNPESIMRNLLMVITILLLVAVIDRLHLLARRELDVQEADRNLAEARFQTLRYQINPHFLFNTLNSIEALSREQPDRIPELVRRLSTFLRKTLDVQPGAFTPFRTEIESAQAYLGIESVRFEERLAVEFDMRPEAGSVLVPELILQPLVENAVKHGMKGSLPLQIRISARLEDGRLIVTVANSGKWMVGKAEAGVGGLGLKNLRERLSHVYGSKFEFKVEEAEGWVVAVLRLPMNKGGGLDAMPVG